MSSKNPPTYRKSPNSGWQRSRNWNRRGTSGSYPRPGRIQRYDQFRTPKAPILDTNDLSEFPSLSKVKTPVTSTIWNSSALDQVKKAPEQKPKPPPRMTCAYSGKNLSGQKFVRAKLMLDSETLHFSTIQDLYHFNQETDSNWKLVEERNGEITLATLPKIVSFTANRRVTNPVDQITSYDDCEEYSDQELEGSESE